MSDIHAAIGRERLKLLDEENEWRRRTGLRYLNSSAGVDAVLPTVPYRFLLQMKDVERASGALWRHGVQAIVPLRWDELLHSRLRISARHFPNAERAARETLSIPIWPGMTGEQVDRVVRALELLR